MCGCGLLAVCAFLFAILGLVAANRASQLGNPTAGNPKVLNLFALVISILEMAAVPIMLLNQGFSLS